MQLDLFVGHFVLLGDDATTNLKSLSVSHSLVLSDSLHQNMMPASGSSFLALHDIVHVVKTQNLVASNALTFSMDAQPRVSIENVGHSLALSQLMKLEPGGAKSTLALTQTVVVSPSKHTSSALQLSQTVIVSSVTRHFSITDYLGLDQGISAYIPKRGFSTFTVTLPDVQDVRFYLPDVVDETFRPPLFGNTDELSFLRVNRRSRGGDLTIFRDNEWPMTETLHLQFDFVNQKDADRLLNVIRQTIGRYLQYTDHEGTSWIAVIKNPDAQRIQAGKNSFQVEVNMEVEKVPTLDATIHDFLNLTQQAFYSTQSGAHLNLSQNVAVHKISSRSVSQNVAIVEDAEVHFGFDRSLTQALDLSQFGSWLNPIQSMSLAQAVGDINIFKRSPTSHLSIAQSINLNVSRGLNPHHFLHLGSTTPEVESSNHYWPTQSLNLRQILGKVADGDPSFSGDTENYGPGVEMPPRITTLDHVTFIAGTANSFNVFAHGIGVPGITESGSLPSGVSFAAGFSIATLSGTPDAGTGGVHTFLIFATNGVTPAASQNFTLTINEAPAITSADIYLFDVLVAGSFTVTATGYPTPTITKSGALPTGVTFVDNGDGTATIAGTPAIATEGGYALTLTAANGVSPDATQSFTVSVEAHDSHDIVVSQTLNLRDAATRMGRINSASPDSSGSTYYNEHEVWTFDNNVGNGDLIVVASMIDYSFNVVGGVYDYVDYGVPGVTDTQGNTYVYLGMEIFRSGNDLGGTLSNATMMYLFYTFAGSASANAVTINYTVPSASPSITVSNYVQEYFGLIDFSHYAHQNSGITAEETVSKDLTIDHPDSLIIAVVCLIDNGTTHTLSYESNWTDGMASGTLAPPLTPVRNLGAPNATTFIDAIGVLGDRPAPLSAAVVSVSCTLHGADFPLIQVMFQTASFKSNNR